MQPPPSHVEYRDRMIAALKKELFGPGPNDENEKEILSVSPLQTYGTGILFPSRMEQNSLEDDQSTMNAEDEITEDGELYDPPLADVAQSRKSSRNAADNRVEEDSLNLANEYSPSALGLTFRCVKLDLLQIKITFGTYNLKTIVKPHHKAGELKADGTYFPLTIERTVYERVPRSELVKLPVSNIEVTTVQHVDVPKTKGMLQLVVTTRPSESNEKIITVMVINRNKLGEGLFPSFDKSFFQVELEVSAVDGNSVFSHIDRPTGISSEEEVESLDLLYRHKKAFGLGHGCACDWNRDESVEINGLTNLVWTTCIPTYEVRPIVPREEPYSVPSIELSMAALSDGNSDNDQSRISSITSSLHELCDDYENWMRDQSKLMSGLKGRMSKAAKRHLVNCQMCLDRMREGVGVLEDQRNPIPLIAFRIANKAMQMQRFHSDLRQRELKSEMPKVPDNYNTEKFEPKWRPFQLAFLLMNIAGIADPEHVDCDLVDLIWFPTGGGKTEAYLGLSAFVIAYRRLSNREDSGTALIMRYTLRLLTAQQFQRASALTIALETLRKNEYLSADLGEAPISIGLWVGKSLSPNKRNDARSALKAMKTKSNVSNPFQVLQCPWCGCRMDDKEKLGYYETKTNNGLSKTVKFRCPDTDCSWGQKDTFLPIYVIDEDLYRNPPTFLLGTVDKFAQIAWSDDVGIFFGIGSNDPAPSLIIQDELHLISGPLGTIVGLFETAIDRFCSLKGNSPKIVASTATIRRSTEQCNVLYARKTFEFPPQALRAGDSYFAEENTTAPGRIYAGVLGTGLKSHSTAQVRVCSTLLQAAVPDADQSKITLKENKNEISPLTEGKAPDSQKTQLANTTDQLVIEKGTYFPEADPYGTMVWYFSSLRELGHATTFCTGDIPEYMKSLCRRNNIPSDYWRRIRNYKELTSRRTADEIPKILEELERKWLPKPDRNYPVDVLLATNMISVGVDVSRLGLMVVTGQPKNTSEYIQATSRVGRRYPGLVVTVYNQGKSRDRSHYEQFVAYHQSFYRYVEATSITPFSPPARERGLRGLLVALARHVAMLDDPSKINTVKPTILGEIKLILDRIKHIDSDECEDAEKELMNALENWENITPSMYGKMGGTVSTDTLMYPYGNDPDPVFQEKSWPVLTSMRNVDKASEARVISEYVINTDD